jgi:uroporphyrinogen-III synthase
MKINTHILSTATLDQTLIGKAMDHHIELDAVSFIEVEHIKENSLAEELTNLCKSRLTTVFTSVNAIHAMAAILKSNKPAWDIYCMGKATKNAVLEYFDASQIKGTAIDGESLAKIIESHKVADVVFFCGDKRLNALPDFLYRHNIMVREIVVYKTKETPEQVAKHYQGIMFYSPNGVNSFFSVNELTPGVVLFAIGNTTAQALKSKTSNKVMVSETPSREQMVDNVIQYFS